MNRINMFLVLFALCLPSWAGADIYMYIDSEGMVHFTNVPTTPDYKLYLREEPRPVKGKTDRFDREIRRAARVFGVDASLVKAVIKAESGFDPKAVSKRGATGLMQLMPSNYDDFKVRDPFDPGQNIMGGTRYLKRLMTRYKGKLPLVLAAYNAGPEAVDRYKSVPPFKETQRYVSKVMKYYAIYNR